MEIRTRPSVMLHSIESLMSQSVISVPPSTRVIEASQLAAERGVRHLLVIEKKDLVGVLCVCDLHAAPSKAAVSHCMTRGVVTVAPDTAPRAAASIMRLHRIGSLPVTRRGSVVGILTRSDLLRGGVTAAELGVEHCASCGYPHNLKPDRRAPEVLFCLYCRERSVPCDDDDDELGSGD